VVHGERAVTPARIEWKPSRLVWRLAWFGMLGVGLAVVLGRPEPLVAAVPALLVVLLGLREAGQRPAAVRVSVDVVEPVAFEDDPVEVQVTVTSPVVLGEIAMELVASGLPGDVEDPGPRVTFGVADVTQTWTVRVHRWGRWTLGPLRLRVRTPSWGYVGSGQLMLSELTVFPPPARARDIAVPPSLLARVGSHAAQRSGPGVEFAGIRAYVPGDAVRRVNWQVSSRRGRSDDLFVNEYAAERAADVVAIVDTTTDVGPPGRSSLDESVRGAAAVVQAYLRYADRVGVVALSGRLRWLAPDIGMRQYYRIVEALLAARHDTSAFEPELARLPRQALPPGALAFVFTPLLDPHAIEAVRNLRERGHPVVVVDVLSGEPPVHRLPGDDRRRLADKQLGLRIWRLEREALLYGLQAIGVTILRWDPVTGIPLERVRLQPILRGTPTTRIPR
jgi:uncharacterized protein (DUF58 family)